MPRFKRSINCAATCDLFKTRKEHRNLENVLKRRVCRKGGTMCARVSEMLHKIGAMPLDLSAYTVLGQGEYGTVLGVCKTGSTRSIKMALKINKDSVGARWEIEMQQKFHAIGLAPAIHGVSHVQGNSFILMDHIDTTIESYLTEKTVSATELTSIFSDIEHAVDVMYDNRLSHGDMHIGNIAVVLDHNGSFDGISFIDFGFSTVREDSSVITRELQVLREYLQLLRSSSNLEKSDEFRRNVMQRLNNPDMIEIRAVFQAGEDLEHSHRTQDDTFEVVHEFFGKNGITGFW